MEGEILKIASLDEMHQLPGYPKPKHPLISLLDTLKLAVPKTAIGSKSISNLYMISIKDKNCGVDYGRNSFDFNEGVMVFSAPGQVYSTTREI